MSENEDLRQRLGLDTLEVMDKVRGFLLMRIMMKMSGGGGGGCTTGHRVHRQHGAYRLPSNTLSLSLSSLSPPLPLSLPPSFPPQVQVLESSGMDAGLETGSSESAVLRLRVPPQQVQAHLSYLKTSQWIQLVLTLQTLR